MSRYVCKLSLLLCRSSLNIIPIYLYWLCNICVVMLLVNLITILIIKFSWIAYVFIQVLYNLWRFIWMYINILYVSGIFDTWIDNIAPSLIFPHTQLFVFACDNKIIAMPLIIYSYFSKHVCCCFFVRI